LGNEEKFRKGIKGTVINKKHFIVFPTLAFSMCVSAMSMLSLYLYIQYKNVEQRACTLLELQETCQQQINVLRQNQNTEEQSVEQQEDSSEASSQESFTIVNRDKKYLKENLKTFVVAQKLLQDGQSLAELYNADEYGFVGSDRKQRSRRVVKKWKKTRTRKRGSQNSAAAMQRLRHSVQNVGAQFTQRDFSFAWPIDLHNFWISSLFGPRKRVDGRPGFHYGVDMAAMRGTPVKSTARGKVLQAQYVPGYGNSVLLVHNQHYRSRYAHLNSILVKVGDVVRAGEVIGTVGDSGYVRKSGKDASHLHFEIHENGVQRNPLRYLFH